MTYVLRNSHFSNKETAFPGPWVVSSLLGAPGEKKRENQMFLQSPLSGEKKSARTFSSPEKKRTFGEGRPSQAGWVQVGPWKAGGGYQRLTYGERWGNLGVTLG